MALLTYRDALNAALREEMALDDRVFLMGEEVAEYDGAYKVSRGLLKEFGPLRVVDTPIAELGFAGIGVGAAMVGLRPVIEFMTWNFALLAIDQVVNSAAKMRYMSGGQVGCPILLRGTGGAPLQLAAQHSQSLYWMTAGIPGLKTVIPSNPADAKGLLLAAIRDDDPVIFCEAKGVLMQRGEVPEGDYTIPIGQAKVVRAGGDVTLVAFGATVAVALAAAEQLAREGTEAEVLDLRSLQPLDEAAIVSSLEKTGRLVVVDESTPRCGIASDVAALCVDRGFDFLNAPVKRVTAPHTPVPFAAILEDAFRPSAEKVIAAVREMG